MIWQYVHKVESDCVCPVKRNLSRKNSLLCLKHRYISQVQKGNPGYHILYTQKNSNVNHDDFLGESVKVKIDEH